jgi:DNA-binding XRE family transcriptional regulator
MDLAKRIRVNEMTIVNWEKGRVRPTKRDLGKIKAVFRFRQSKCITE